MTISMTAQTRPQSWDVCVSLSVGEEGVVVVVLVTYLETTKKSVVNHIVIDLLASIVLARPTPHIVAAAAGLGVLVDSSADNPHDQTEEEEADRERGIVDCGLFGATVAALPVGPEDNQTGKQGDASHAQEQVLGPWVGAYCPGGETVASREGLGCVEDGQCDCQDGQHDQTAAEVDEAQEDLGDADAEFDPL